MKYDNSEYNLPGLQSIDVDVADVTEHGVEPILTILLEIMTPSKPLPKIFIKFILLVSILETIGVAELNHSKSQLAEHFDGMPLMLTEN
jgi:hypothetical protein